MLTNISHCTAVALGMRAACLRCLVICAGLNFSSPLGPSPTLAPTMRTLARMRHVKCRGGRLAHKLFEF